MIIEGLITFLVLSLAFIIVGKYSENMVMELSGFLIIILLSFTFFSGQIMFKSGENITTDFNYNNDSLVSSTQENMEINYTDFTQIDKVIYGLLLLFSGIMGMFSIWQNYKGNFRGEEE